MNAPVRTTVNTGLITMIVAVATIGGLLFGYDSGAVNLSLIHTPSPRDA